VKRRAFISLLGGAAGAVPSFDADEGLTPQGGNPMRTWLRVALGLSLGLPLALLTLAPVGAQTPLTTLPSAGPQTPASPHMEIIHHPNYDKTVFMPFVPGIKIKSGKILWLAGTTALPVYHDHPHKREQIQQYMTGNLEDQTKRTMDGIKQTFDAAGPASKTWCTCSCSALARRWATSAAPRG
jgi:enamine deaminase RidA (YjgF/YER057c/UK114 family)